MKKTEKITQTIERYEHSFYCDSCNEYIGTSREYNDGWYLPLGEFELKFKVVDEYYRLNRCLCDNCKNNLINNIKSILEGMGFERY